MVAFSAPKAPTSLGGGGRIAGMPTALEHAAAPRQAPSYVGGAAPPSSPKSGILGMFGPPADPQRFGPRKSIRTQDLGSVVGRRGSGIAAVAGGDQDLHSVQRYGKKAPGGGGVGGLGGGGVGPGGLF
jgi:hypothetical protein